MTGSWTYQVVTCSKSSSAPEQVPRNVGGVCLSCFRYDGSSVGAGVHSGWSMIPYQLNNFIGVPWPGTGTLQRQLCADGNPCAECKLCLFRPAGCFTAPSEPQSASHCSVLSSSGSATSHNMLSVASTCLNFAKPTGRLINFIIKSGGGGDLKRKSNDKKVFQRFHGSLENNGDCEIKY